MARTSALGDDIDPLLEEAKGIGTFIGDKREMTDAHRLALLNDQLANGDIADGWQRNELEGEIKRLEKRVGKSSPADKREAIAQEPGRAREGKSLDDFYIDPNSALVRKMRGLPLTDPPKPEEPKEEPAGVTRRILGDTVGIDFLGKGAIDIGESAVGLADLASFGAAGKALAWAGYDPTRARAMLDEMYTPQRKQANENVAAAKGFFESLGAMVENPSNPLGSIAESIPGMVGIGAAGAKLAGSIFLKGARTVAGGVTMQGGEMVISDAAQKVGMQAVKDAANKIAWTVSGTEGAQAAGSIAEQARQAGREWKDYALPAVAGGGITAAIGRAGQAIGGGKYSPEQILTRALSSSALNEASARGAAQAVKGRLGQTAAGVLGGFATEGGEELGQSVNEQIMGNVAQGRPVGEGVAEAGAQGLLTGGVMGGGIAGAHAALAPRAAPQTQQQPPQPQLGAPAPAAQPVVDPATGLPVEAAPPPATPQELRDEAEREIDKLAQAARHERTTKDADGNTVVDQITPEENDALAHLRKNLDNPEVLATYFGRTLATGQVAAEAEEFKFQSEEGKRRLAEAGIDPMDIDGAGDVISDADVTRAIEAKPTVADLKDFDPEAKAAALAAGLDPLSLTGRGRGGRITVDDVNRAIKARDTAALRRGGAAPAQDQPGAEVGAPAGLAADALAAVKPILDEQGVTATATEDLRHADSQESFEVGGRKFTGTRIGKRSLAHLQRFAKLFGKDLVLYDNAPGQWAGDGFTHPKSGKHIFLSSVTQGAPHMVVFGHELMHSMSKDMPLVFQRLKKAVTKIAKPDAVERMKKQYSGGEAMSEDAIWDEIVSDMGGNRLGEVETWKKIFRGLENHGMVARVANYVRGMIGNLITRAKHQKGFATDDYMRDIERVRDAVADAAIGYIRFAQKPVKVEEKKVVNAPAQPQPPPEPEPEKPKLAAVPKAAPPPAAKPEEPKPAAEAKPEPVAPKRAAKDGIKLPDGQVGKISAAKLYEKGKGKGMYGARAVADMPHTAFQLMKDKDGTLFWGDYFELYQSGEIKAVGEHGKGTPATFKDPISARNAAAQVTDFRGPDAEGPTQAEKIAEMHRKAESAGKKELPPEKAKREQVEKKLVQKPKETDEEEAIRKNATNTAARKAAKGKPTARVQQLLDEYTAGAWDDEEALQDVLESIQEDMDINAMPELLPAIAEVAQRVNARLEELQYEPISESKSPAAKKMKAIAGMKPDYAEVLTPDGFPAEDPEPAPHLGDGVVEYTSINDIGNDDTVIHNGRKASVEMVAVAQDKKTKKPTSVAAITYADDGKQEIVAIEELAKVEGEFRAGESIEVNPILQLTGDEEDVDLPPKPAKEVFPAPKQKRIVQKELGKKYIAQAQADRLVAAWKAEAKRMGKEEDHSKEVILSLFDYTGNWSKPFREAGFNVIQYDIKAGDDVLFKLPVVDIKNLQAKGYKIVGVLAAPPCTSFSVAGAQFWKEQHDKADPAMVEKKYGADAAFWFDTPLEYGKAMVDATRVVVELANPEWFHVAENPVGRFRTANALPDPLLVFQPNNFGDSYTKETQLWGDFNPELPTANVDPVQGSLMHKKMAFTPEQKAERSITPEGFAYAFFMANRQKPKKSFVKKSELRLPEALKRNLLPQELGKLRKDTAAKISETMRALPPAREMAAIAHAGRAKRGWYAKSSKALLQVFGEDAPRFAALLAATSPQVSVESNLMNALSIWANWVQAGRPTDREAITNLMGDSVQQAPIANRQMAPLIKLAQRVGVRLGGSRQSLAARLQAFNDASPKNAQLVKNNSVLDAWVPNTVRSLVSEDPAKLLLSGPKVDSFMRNLLGVTNEVTNDAWMAAYAFVDQKLFSGAMNVLKTDPGKGTGYLAMNARVRQAAQILTEQTGRNWTPAEVQETIWSWAKTVYETSERAGETRTMARLLQDRAITDEMIGATPDFARLFNETQYRKLLERAGLEPPRAGSPADQQEPGAGREAAPFDRPTQERLEAQAARRLERLKRQRAVEEAAKAKAVKRSELRAPLFEQSDKGPALVGEKYQILPQKRLKSFFPEPAYRHHVFYRGRRVGDVDLAWDGDKILRLTDINVAEDLRGQGVVGPEVLRDLLLHNGDGYPITLINIIDQRRAGWWARMGAVVARSKSGVLNGEITLQGHLGQGVAADERPGAAAGGQAAADTKPSGPADAGGRAPDRQDQGPEAPPAVDRSTLRNTDQRVGPRWYSELQRKITAGPNSAPRAAWLGYIEGLKQKGVKPEEIEWSGVKDWLAAGPDAAVVKKEDIQKFLGENGVRIEERTMTGQGKLDVTIDRDWSDDEPDENYFRQEAEDIYLDEARRYLEANAHPAGTPVSDDEVMDRAIEIAKSNYYDDSERARKKDVEVEFGGKTYRFVATFQHGEMEIFAPANQGNELDKRGGENVLDVAGGSRSQTRAMDNPQIERAVKDYLAEVLQADFDEEEAPYESYTLSGGTNYTINLLKLPTEFTPDKTFVERNHFDDKNIIAHVRTKDRIDSDGKKVLFLEEIQSDWAQQGRDRGFYDPADKDKIGLLRDKVREFGDSIEAADSLRKKRQGDLDYWRGKLDKIRKPEDVQEGEDQLEKAIRLRDDVVFDYNRLDSERGKVIREIDKLRAKNVPEGPFVKKTDSWVGLVLKRMLMRAVNEGYEAVAWTTGAQQAERYNLANYIGQIMARPAIGSAGVLGASQDIWVQASAKNTGRVIHSADVRREELAGVVGKEMALKIIKDIDADRGTHVYNNLDLSVGGEGMTTFYEGIVPKVANDILKKLGGGKVGTVPIGKAHREDIRISQHADGSATVEDGGKSTPFTTVAAAERYRDQLTGLKSQPGFYITEANKKSLDEGVPLMSALRNAQEAVQSAPSVKFGFEPEWASESRRQPKTGKANSVVEQPLATFNKGTIEAREFTAYDNKGKLVGVLSVVTKGSGLGAFKITVRENAQRQGYGLKLLDAAEQAGIDMKASLAANRFTSEGRALAMSWLEKSDKDKELLRSALRLPRGDDVMYHATFTKSAEAIKREGITQQKKGNWRAAGGFRQLGTDGVYAFEDLADAVRWAARMDWSFNPKQEPGKVSVVAFKKSDGWTEDNNDPLSKSNARGQWLKRAEPVPASDILAVEQYTQDDAKRLVELLNEEYAPKRSAMRRTIATDSLPEDMQQLLLDMWEMMSDKPMPQNLPVKTMPVSAFPQAELSAADDRGGIAHAEQMPDVSELPPVVIVGDDWVDGAHRIEAARMQGATEIQAIDLGELGVQYPKGKLPYNGTIKRSAIRNGPLRPRAGTVTGRLMHEPTLMGAPLDIRSRAYYMLREGKAESEVIELLNDVGVRDPQAAIDELKKSTWRNHVANAIANQAVPSSMAKAVRDQLSDAIRPTEPGSFNLWHRTVGTQHHKSTISKHFKKVFDLVNKFLDDISMFAMRAESMAPRIFTPLNSWKNIFKTGLSREDNELIGRALAEGTLAGGKNPHAGKVWTDAELISKYNMTPDQRSIYRQARASLDQTLDDTAKALMAQIARTAKVPDAIIQSLIEQNLPLALTRDQFIAGLPNQTKTSLEAAKQIRIIEGETFSLKEHGYSPLMRFGKYTVEAKDAAGKTVFFSMHETKADRERALDAAGATFPGHQILSGEMNEEEHKMLAGVSPSTMEAFINAMPYTNAQQEAARQAYLQLAVANRSALKRMIERQGTAGYSHDATRTLASFITSNARYASKAVNGSQLFASVKNIPRGTGNVAYEATKLYDYIMNPGEGATAIRGFLFFHFLGASLAAGVVNLTQPALMTFPHLAQHGVRRAARAMTAALDDTSKWLRNRRVGDPQLQAALEQAAKKGIIEPQEIFQLMAAARSGVSSLLQQKFMRFWGLNFALTEIFNRTLTFAAAFRVGREIGHADPYTFAVESVLESQGQYNKGNRPNWARETGALGTAGTVAFTFKQYGIAYVEFLKRLYGAGLLPKKSFLLALGALALASGAEGMPGSDDLDDLLETIAAWLGIPLNMKKEKRKFLREAIGFGPGATEFMLHGVSAGLPFDVSARLGAQNLIPGTALFNPTKDSFEKTSEALEVIGPVGGFAKNMTEGARKLAGGEFVEAGKSVLPKAVRDLVQGSEMLATGKMKDQQGRLTMQATPAEAVSKMAGFNPERVAHESRVIDEERTDQQIVAAKRKELHQRLAKAIAEGDGAARESAMDDWRKWNQKNPDYRFSINYPSVAKQAQDMRRTRAERFIKGSPKDMRRSAREALTTDE